MEELIFSADLVKLTPGEAGEDLEFLITVEPMMNGFGFVVMRHDAPAQDFGQRLAVFLRYDFSDLVPPQYRKLGGAS